MRWARTGGEPLMDLDFLLQEIDRVMEDEPRVSAAGIDDALRANANPATSMSIRLAALPALAGLSLLLGACRCAE